MNIENIPTLNVNIEKVGPQGFSAYEIYLQGGGTLSEQEWLDSLKGETGLTPDVQAGETITLDSTELAKVTRTGTNENPIFTFAIPRGPIGESGADGKEGPAGKEGPEGPAGKSAYQIWLEAGNEGTEQDFLNSLIGPEGSAGLSLEEVKNITGDLDDLSTEDKTNLVNAINEVLENASGESVDPKLIVQTIGANQSLENRTSGVYLYTDSISNKVYLTSAGKYLNMETGEILFYSSYKAGTNTYSVAFKFVANSEGKFCINYVARNSYSNKTSQGYLNFENLNTINTAQSISAKKTYSVLPESSVTPTTDNQLVNKSYVDTLLASARGTEEITGTVNLSTKPYGVYRVGSGGVTLNLGSGGFSLNSDIVFVYTVGYYSYTTYKFVCYLDYGNARNQLVIRGYYLKDGESYPTLFVQDLSTFVNKNESNTIGGTFTFTALPKSSVTPTTDNQLTNKKYVDDSIAAAITNVLEGEY